MPRPQVNRRRLAGRQASTTAPAVPPVIPPGTTDVHQVIGMYQNGASSGSSPGGGGSPPQQLSYVQQQSPWLTHPVQWGLNYLNGPTVDMSTTPYTVDWSSWLSVSPFTGTNYAFMQDRNGGALPNGGKINYSVGMLPFWTTNSPYTVHLPNDGVGGPTADLARGATGVWDSHWAAFAQSVADQHNYLTGTWPYKNMHDIWINLGWEGNENSKYFGWGYSTLTEAANYATYFAKIVSAMRTQVPGRFKFTWNILGGPPYVTGIIDAAYPGDAYVDAVGMEMYDETDSPPGGRLSDGSYATPSAVWAAARDATPWGYNYLRQFCIDHAKAYAVPEWGLVPNPVQSATRPQGVLNGGGDNPYFINAFAAYVASFPPLPGGSTNSGVAYVNCFNLYSSDNIDHQLNTYPAAKAAFRAAF